MSIRARTIHDLPIPSVQLDGGGGGWEKCNIETEDEEHKNDFLSSGSSVLNILRLDFSLATLTY